MKEILEMLDKPVKDSLYDKIQSEPVAKKYSFNFGMTVLCCFATVLIGSLIMIQRNEPSVPETLSVDLKQKTAQQIMTLPFPHQSFKNVSSWLIDAITTSYSFSFSNVDKQIESAGYYFTSDGYTMYLRALEANKIRETVINDKINVSILPMQDPVMINGGRSGGTEFWRFRVPVLTSYTAGRAPIVQKNMVEVLILRVPAHENHKGLAIAEFNMVPI